MSKPWLQKSKCKRGHLRCKNNLNSANACKKCAKLWYLAHRKESIAARLQWRKDHPRQARLTARSCDLKRKGWTTESFKAAIKKQKNLCAMCGKKFTKKNIPCADHRHTVNPTPRGVIHNSCNLVIGWAKDDPTLCHLAAAYLEWWDVPVMDVDEYPASSMKVLEGIEATKRSEVFVPEEEQ